MWSEWVYDAVPQIGDYVQVDIRHKETGERKIEKGEIGGKFGTVMWFVGDLPMLTCDWMALRWRFWIEPPRQQQETEEVEYA